MIFYLSIVLLILVSIALYQRLYSLTGFLIATYFMYIVIIYFSGTQRGEKNPPIDAPTNFSGNVQIDTTKEACIDSEETLEDFTVTTDSIPSEQLALNYITVARNVDIKKQECNRPWFSFSRRCRHTLLLIRYRQQEWWNPGDTSQMDVYGKYCCKS